MNKVYVVKSSCGEYEDYSCWNEKAFLNKEDAKKYAKELDDKHFNKPSFITDEFAQAIQECEFDLPDYEDFPDEITNENRDDYLKWLEQQENKQTKMLIDMMYKKGYFLTEEMYAQFNEWLDRQGDYYDCEIEELELI